MKILIIFLFLFISFSSGYAFFGSVDDLSGSGNSKDGEQAGKDAFNKAKNYIGQSDEVLKQSQSPSDVSNEKGSINSFMGNLDGNLKSVMGTGDTKIYAIDGNSHVDAKMHCMGQDKIAEITYSGDDIINMDINIIKQGNIKINNIKGICPTGFMVCDSNFNTEQCNILLKELSDTEKANHPCSKFKGDCMNWNFKNTGQKIYLDTIGHSSCPISNDKQALTGQLSAVLSSAYFTSIADIKESNNGNNVELHSLDSSKCGGGGDMDGLGIGGFNLDELSKIYKSGTYPTDIAETEFSKKREGSIVDLLEKSQKTEYEDGVSIGASPAEKCEIINTVDATTEKKTVTHNETGSISINTKNEVYTYISADEKNFILTFQGLDLNGKVLPGEDVYIPKKSDDAKYASFIFDISGYTFCKPFSYSTSASGFRNRCDKINEGGEHITFHYKFTQEYTKETLISQSSINTVNSCNDLKGCEVLTENICNTDSSSCTQTIANKVATGNVFQPYQETKTFNGVVATITYGSNTIRVSNNHYNKVHSTPVNEGFPVIERTYICPIKNDGLKAEKTMFDNLFGEMASEQNFGNPNFAENFKNQQNQTYGECFVQTCTVKKIYNKDNIHYDGLTNADIGNALSEETEIRQCEYNATGETSFTCPVDKQNGETRIKECSCDNSDALGQNLGKVLTATSIIDRVTDEIDKICNTESSKIKEAQK